MLPTRSRVLRPVQQRSRCTRVPKICEACHLRSISSASAAGTSWNVALTAGPSRSSFVEVKWPMAAFTSADVRHLPGYPKKVIRREGDFLYLNACRRPIR